MEKTKQIITIDSIARELAVEQGITIKLANTLVKSTLNIIGNNMNVNTKVYLDDFGVFKVAERMTQQPMTNNVVKANVISFKSFSSLKNKVK